MWIIALVLLILWLIGVLAGYTLSGFIHVILAAAIIVAVVKLYMGEKKM